MDKQYHIKLKKQEIPVSEEVYRAYMRPKWREKKNEQVREDMEISLFSLSELCGDESIEDTVLRNLLITEFHSTINDLPEKDRRILYGLYFENKTEQELSLEIHIPQQTISYRKSAILKRLKNKLKKFL